MDRNLRYDDMLRNSNPEPATTYEAGDFLILALLFFPHIFLILLAMYLSFNIALSYIRETRLHRE